MRRDFGSLLSWALSQTEVVLLNGKISLAISSLLLAKADLEKMLVNRKVDQDLIDKARTQIKLALNYLEPPPQ
jgi:hypothetical protein